MIARLHRGGDRIKVQNFVQEFGAGFLVQMKVNTFDFTCLLFTFIIVI